ncbi:MAG TPA: metallophosphoesterase [Tepidisphaeraceae bacterium]|jgi:3',5'-cyclic AMP phosphodiesterase CpdA
MPISLPPISRRGFIRGALTAAGAMALGPQWSSGAQAADPNRLALFSDIHLNGAKTPTRGVNMWQNFVACREQVLAMETRPAAMLINGDCAHLQGKPEDYRTVLEAIAPARAKGIPVHLALGNHDNRENILKSIPADKTLSVKFDRRAMIVPLPTADWYILDSLERTSHTPGTLGPVQITWLKKTLDARPKRPAVIMLHHQMDWINDGKISGLSDTKQFIDVIKPRNQVKAVLFGHTHVWKHYNRDGLHFINLPTTAYVFREGEPAGWVDAKVTDKSMTLQLHTVDANHPENKQTLNLPWR